VNLFHFLPGFIKSWAAPVVSCMHSCSGLGKLPLHAHYLRDLSSYVYSAKLQTTKELSFNGDLNTVILWFKI